MRIYVHIYMRAVGKAAREIFTCIDALPYQNPTKNATQYFGDHLMGQNCPLNGRWKQVCSLSY